MGSSFPNFQPSVYTGVTEVSIYVDPIYQGKGISKQLIKRLIEQSEKVGL